MQYFLEIVSPETWQHFCQRQDEVGYRKRHLKVCTEIRPGDLLICYLKHLSRFCGVLEVQSELCRNKDRKLYGRKEIFPLCFKVRRIVTLEMEVAVPIKEEEVWNRLSITRQRKLGKPGWAGFFRNSLNRFNESDGSSLVGLLEKQQANPNSYPLTDKDRRRLAQKNREPLYEQCSVLSCDAVNELNDKPELAHTNDLILVENTSKPTLKKSAERSADGLYGYSLSREWDPSRPKLIIVMLNPSGEDAGEENVTIRRCMQHSQHWGFGGLAVLNLFAWRTQKPKGLKAPRVQDPIGPDNREAFKRVHERVLCHNRKVAPAAEDKDRVTVLCAWGVHGGYLKQDQIVMGWINESWQANLVCLGLTKYGFPRHPLYVRLDIEMVPFNGRPLAGGRGLFS